MRSGQLFRATDNVFTMDMYEFNLCLQAFRLRDRVSVVVAAAAATTGDGDDHVVGGGGVGRTGGIKKQKTKTKTKKKILSMASVPDYDAGIGYTLSGAASEALFASYSKTRKSYGITGATKLSIDHDDDNDAGGVDVAAAGGGRAKLKPSSPVRASIVASDSLEDYQSATAAADAAAAASAAAAPPVRSPKAKAKTKEVMADGGDEDDEDDDDDHVRSVPGRKHSDWDYHVQEGSLDAVGFVQALVHVALHTEVGALVDSVHAGARTHRALIVIDGWCAGV